MKILITGYNGFIGSNLTLSLLKSGHTVYGISTRENDSQFNQFNNFNSIKCNYTDFHLYQEIMKDIEIIIHLAYSTVPENSTKNPVFDIQSNVISTISFYKYASTFNVKKFIFVSSGGVVYGNANSFPITENENLNPVSSYGISKMILENNIRMLSNQLNLPFCIFRIANVYGKGFINRRNQGVINIWLDKIRKGEAIEMIGNGEIVRDFIYMEDVVDAFQKVLDEDIVGTFNIGTGVGTNLNELINYLEEITGKKAVITQIEDRKFDVLKNILSYEKFEKISNWNPKTSLKKGIEILSSQ